MPGTIKLNEPITFGKSGSVRELNAFGFDLSEPAMSWTQEEVAGFSGMLTGLSAEPAVRVIVGAAPFIHLGHVTQQQFFLFVNGLFVGFRTLASPQKVLFTLPRSLVSPRGLRFEFVVPTAASPKSLGIGQDVRKLGISLSEVVLSAPQS